MNHSYREVLSDTVLAACERYLQHRDALIAEQRERLIEEGMKPGLFGTKRSREQVIQSFENDRWSRYQMLDIWCGREAARVQALVSLCSVPSDWRTVKLSAQDAAILAQHFGQDQHSVDK